MQYARRNGISVRRRDALAFFASCGGFALSPWLVCALGQDGAAEKTPDADESDEVDVNEKHPVRVHIDKSIEKYRYVMSDRPEEKTTYKAIQRWTNVSRDPFGEGVLVVWFDRGLPICTTHIYPWQDNLNHECIGVSRDPFVIVDERGSELWKPRKSGAEFVKLPGAETPADRPVERARQLKAIASRFSATLLGWNPDNSDREELRMLDRPLHRYTGLPKNRPHGVIDGAIFAFVQGTDPEVLLIVEALENDKGERSWQYAAVRATSGELNAKLDDTVVWHADKITFNAGADSSRFSIATRLPPEVLAARKPKN
jgi:hypothetical protein